MMKINTKQGLINMLELNQSYHSDRRTLNVIAQIQKLDLPILEDGNSYTTRFKDQNHEEIIKHLEFWNENLTCIDFKNKEVVAVVEINTEKIDPHH